MSTTVSQSFSGTESTQVNCMATQPYQLPYFLTLLLAPPGINTPLLFKFFFTGSVPGKSNQLKRPHSYLFPAVCSENGLRGIASSGLSVSSKGGKTATKLE